MTIEEQIKIIPGFFTVELLKQDKKGYFKTIFLGRAWDLTSTTQWSKIKDWNYSNLKVSCAYNKVTIFLCREEI